ncbi:MAG: LuxR C-terminal-related transcriptional regulator [Muribaculaceae bacterium]|nr:LuxR C-terminal-related transcriptional regulator [Muribaculaceae bacterium]
MRHLNIILCTPSTIEFNGLCTVLRNVLRMSVSFRAVETTVLDGGNLLPSNADLLICDPVAVTRASLLAIRRSSPKLKIILLYHTALPQDYVREYDAAISVYDSEATIEQTVTSLFATRKSSDGASDLTQREKEIIMGVVKGLSNKEIAANINVSVNTVMTHRRNIAAKLQIHSPAGLTVYALMSNLITLDELSN